MDSIQENSLFFALQNRSGLPSSMGKFSPKTPHREMSSFIVRLESCNVAKGCRCLLFSPSDE